MGNGYLSVEGRYARRVVILRIETPYFGSDQNLLEKCRKRSLYVIGDDDS